MSVHLLKAVFQNTFGFRCRVPYTSSNTIVSWVRAILRRFGTSKTQYLLWVVSSNMRYHLLLVNFVNYVVKVLSPLLDISTLIPTLPISYEECTHFLNHFIQTVRPKKLSANLPNTGTLVVFVISLAVYSYVSVLNQNSSLTKL